jgi:hypothetical protein
MFEGYLIGFDKLGALMKRTGSENQPHGRIVRQPVPFILGHLLVVPLVQHLVFLEPGLH